MTKLHRQVRHFHDVFGIPVVAKPQVPSRERRQLRCKLVLEEALEFLEAHGCPVASLGIDKLIERSIEQMGEAGEFDMEAVADACGDIDYVVEGSRIEYGIDGGPIADEIHRSNMAKVGGPVLPGGKIGKPDGWTPPDIKGLLVKQGWEGE
jgi:predicted HAD superfamily Cof-like phosphohydrolase